MGDVIDKNVIGFTSLVKAKEVFELFRQDMHTDRDRAGAIQSFEFCYELAWKTIKRVLAKRGIEVNSPRDAIRQAALNKLISDPKQWFVFIEKRNLASHTYDQETVKEVIAIFGEFSKALQELISNLGAAA
jgi:nucleotidyltransferase substrate binding protein (TIGR01987 family)